MNLSDLEQVTRLKTRLAALDKDLAAIEKPSGTYLRCVQTGRDIDIGFGNPLYPAMQALLRIYTEQRIKETEKELASLGVTVGTPMSPSAGPSPR